MILRQRIFLLSILLIIILNLQGIAGRAAQVKNYVSGEIIVKLKPNSPSGFSAFSSEPSSIKALLPELASQEILQARKLFLGRAESSLSAQNADSGASTILSIRVAEDADEEALVRALGDNSAVEYAQLNHYIQLCVTPNDMFYSSNGSWGQSYDDMWAIKKMEADKAWDITTGISDIVVAVIDSGVDYNHPELRGRVIKGYDFSDYDDDPMDEDGHGTHIAGIIAAGGNNGAGISGLAWDCRILAIKVLPYGTELDVADAIIYAAHHAAGVDVINLSLRLLDTESSPIVSDAIYEAANKDIVVVAAAGNLTAGQTSDVSKIVPANHPEVIAVTSTDMNDEVSSFSCAGDAVDIAAPGGGSGNINEIYNVLSLKCSQPDSYYNPFVVSDYYLRLGGTSMAAPFVSGLAALILSKNPGLTKYEVEQIIKNNADDIAPLGWDSKTGFGRINAYKALAATPDPVGGIGEPPDPGDGNPVKLEPPEWVKNTKVGDMALDNCNNMYVVYTNQHRVVKYKLSPEGNVKSATIVASVDTFGGDQMCYPMGIAVAANGEFVLVADTYNNRILVFDDNLQEISSLSNVNTLRLFVDKHVHQEYAWGFVKIGYETRKSEENIAGDSLLLPMGVDISDSGKVIVSDLKKRILVMGLDSSGNLSPQRVESKLAEDDVENSLKYWTSIDWNEGWRDLSGTAGVAFVISPYLVPYMKATYTGTVAQAAAWTPLGWFLIALSAVLGEEKVDSVDFYGNWIDGQAWLDGASDIAFASWGQIYTIQVVQDKVYKINMQGSFLQSLSGDGTSGFDTPVGLSVDIYGNLYVADSGNRRIVQFDPAGKFTKEFKSENLIDPIRIDIKNGKVYIADANSNIPLVWNIAGEISNLRVSDAWLSPNADGKKDETLILYDLSQPADISIQAVPKDSGASASSADGLILKNVSGIVGENKETWDGTVLLSESSAQGADDNAQNVIADGDYSLKVTASFGDYVKSKSVDLHIDTEKPSLALNRDPPAISPNDDDVNDGLIIDYTLSDNLSPTAEVKATFWKNGMPLNVALDEKVPISDQPSADTFVWNGKIANYVVEGDYVISLEATDLAGNTAVATAGVLVDNSPPQIEQLSISEPYFSPNEDGKKDTTEIAFNLSDTFSENIYVTVLLEDISGVKVSTILKREDLPAGEHKFVWAGNNENGQVPDGEYVFRVYAEDLAGNLGTAEPIAVVLDTVPPSIDAFAADPNPFSPNNDGMKDRTLFSYSLSEPCYAVIKIFREDNTLFRDHRLYNVNNGQFAWDGSGFHGGILGEDHPYYLYAEDRAGNVSTSETEIIIVQHEPSLIPYAYADPDPFAPVNPDNSSTEIKYYLSRDNLAVTVEVIGKEGRIVKSLVNGEVQNKGEHSVVWQGDFDAAFDGPNVENKVADGAWEFKVEASANDASNPALTSNTVLVDNMPPYILTEPVVVDVVNRTASMKYSLPETSSLEIGVYDVDHNLIAEIENIPDKSPGVYIASWQPNSLPNDPAYFKVSAIDKALNRSNKSTEFFSIVPQEPLQVANHNVSPNPFTPNGDGLSDLTQIAYQVSGGAPEYVVSINILTDTGATVKQLVENEPQSPGTYVFYWNGKNDANQLAADGFYDYEIIVEDKLGVRIEEEGPVILVSTRPTVNLSANLSTFSPNGDGLSDTLMVDYSVAYPMQYITGEALVKLSVIDSSGEAVWERIFNHTAGSYNYEYDGTTTSGTSLPASSYYMKASAEDALGATAIPKMVEFMVDYTQPEPSDFSITPQYAKLGTTVSIQLEFQEELLGSPEVNVVGLGPAYLELSSGNSYVYSYTVDSDDPEGVTTVSVEAQDLALNTINRTNTFVIDNTNPQVSNIAINPNPASIPGVSGQVSIQFMVNEALRTVPRVYVAQDGAVPQMAIVGGDWDQANGLCEGKYDAISGYDGSALITIEVTDLAGNVRIQEQGGLVIDTISPIFSNIQSEISSNPDFATFAKEGSEVSVRFQTSEDLIYNPIVRINGESAAYDSLNSHEYTYRHMIDSGDSEGNATISISGFDFAGNNGTAETASSAESFIIDLTNPTVSISFDPGMIANPSPFSTNASSEVGHRQTRLQYETSEQGLVTVSIYKLPNAQTSYSSNDFGSSNLIISYSEGWLDGGTNYKYWDGEIQNNQANYDLNGNGFADPGKYAFIVEVKDRAGNLLEGKWGGTCWIQDNLLVLESPDQVIQDNPYPQYFSPNNDGTFEVTEVFFRVKLGVTPAEPALPERIAIFGLPGDFKWLEGVVKTVGSYTVRVYDETKTNLIRTVITDAPLYSNIALSETWDGRDDSNQHVSEGTYQIEIDARDFIGGAAEDNLLTLTATVDVSAPQVVSNEPDLASTPWSNTGKSYDVDFFDNQNAYASSLKDAQYKVTTATGQGGSIQVDWTDIFSELDAGSYTSDWGSGIFNACGQGTYYVSVRVIDNAGNETIENDVYFVKKDTLAPINPSININSGAAYAGTQAVDLAVGASDSHSGVGQIWVRNDGGSYQQYLSSPWMLRNLDGQRYTYAKFRDNAGNWTTDDIVSDSIILDRGAPTITAPTVSNNPFNQMYESTTISWAINDVYSVSVHYEAGIYTTGEALVKMIRNYGDGAVSNGGKSFVWDGTNDAGDYVNEGDYKFKVRAKDLAGNESGWNEAVIQARDDVRLTINSVADYASNSIDMDYGSSGIHLIWQDNRSGVYRTQYMRSVNGGVSWTAEQEVYGYGNSEWTPAIDVNGNNVLVGIAEEGMYNSMVWEESPDGGVTWNTHGRSMTGFNIKPVDIAYHPYFVAVNSSASGTNISFNNSMDRNNWFLITSSNTAHFPSMGSNGSNVHVVWSDTRDGNDEIYYKKSVNEGNNWSGDIKLSNTAGSSIYPNIAVDGNNIHIVWVDEVGGEYGIYYQRSTDNGSTWTSGVKLATIPQLLWHFPKVVCIGNDVHVVWGTDGFSDHYIYYKRSTDNGTTWSSTAKLTNIYGGMNPALCADISGNAYIAWREQRVGDAGIQIYFQKIPRDFAPVKGTVTAFLAGPVDWGRPVVQATTLEAPILISPGDQASENSIRPTFQWDHLKTADLQEYRIDLSKNDIFTFGGLSFTKSPDTGSPDKDDPTLYHYTYSIHEFDPGLDRDTYYWKVTAVATSESATSEIRSFTVAPQLTLTDVTNYPNPFNPNKQATKIRYRLGASADSVKIRIYDVVGSLVKEISNCPTAGEGSSVWDKYHDVDWDGRNGRGGLVVNGIYPFEVIARLGNQSVSARGKIAVLK